MVRGFVWTFVAFCIFLSLVVGSTIWLLYSSAGADFVLRRLSQHLDGHIEASRVEGSLARGLTLENLTIIQDNFSLTAAHIHLAATVSSIYPLEMNFSAVEVNDAVLVLPAGEPVDKKPATFALKLPELSKIFDLVRVTVTDLLLENLSIQQPDEIFIVNELQISAQFIKRRLSIDQFTLNLDELSVAATLDLDMADPSLAVAATLLNPDMDQLWEKLVINAHLNRADPDSLSGSISLQGRLTGLQPFWVDTDIHLADNVLTVDELLLRQAQREGSIQASGRFRMEHTGPVIDVQAVFHDFDVSQEADIPLQFAGLVDVSYAQSLYHGHLDLTSSGHELAGVSLSGNFSGDHQQIVVDQVRALWLGAQIDGGFNLDWSSTLELAAEIDIHGLSLEPLVPQSSGLINARLSATYLHLDQQPQADLTLELFDSFFHDYPLSGNVDVAYEDNNLIVNRLSLYSNSAHLQAQGDLLSKFDFNLSLDRLADLYPQAEGSLTAQGWFRKTDDVVEADIHFDVGELSHDQWHLMSLSGHLALDAEQRLSATAEARHLRSTDLDLLIDTIDLMSEGTLADHHMKIDARSQQSELAASIQGSWSESTWSAVLEQFHIAMPANQWRLLEPAYLVVKPEIISLSSVSIDGGSRQAIRLNGEYLPAKEKLQIDIAWNDLSLSWLKNWLDPFPLEGHVDGQIFLTHQPDQTNMSISVLSVADLHYQKIHLQDTETRLKLNWGPDGLVGSLRFDIGQPAHLLLQVQSPQAAGLYLPDHLDLTLVCRALPLRLLQLWLPAELIAEGSLNCDVSGWWNADSSFALESKATITEGSLFWYDGEQAVDIALESAGLELLWKEDGLQGQVTIQHDYGHINGSLEVGVPPLLPVVLSDTLSINADVGFLLRESGLLSVFFPQHIYDSRGRINLSASVSGTIGDPSFGGSFALDEAEIYIPAAGIRLFNMAADAQMKDQQLEVSALTVTSGEGTIAGQGRVDLQGWVPQTYQFVLEGSQFQLVNLTGLTAHVSPDLVLEGDMQHVRVRGHILFPWVMITDQVSPQIAQNSPDLIIIDRPVPDSKVGRIAHDIDINLLLGDQVLLDVAGLEARVAGSLRLYSDPQQNFAAQGRLYVVRGRYSTYGVTLDIERGDLYYAGVPLRYPTLDILALRRAGQVRAGVRISGTPQEPLVTLYSEPAMPDADVLSYMVLGRPLDSSGGDTDLLMVAAGALLSQGESIVLQERLRGRIGLDVLEFSAGEGDVRDSVITTGKYLTPDLYVSLGYSLFNNTNEIKVRYRLTSRLELESTFGQESGVDLFYRLERE